MSCTNNMIKGEAHERDRYTAFSSCWNWSRDILHRATGAPADKDYGPGVTDTEIKLGTTSPYSGPASAYGIYGQAQTAYFNMINDQGGINGRRVTLISLDNGYNPPKALEQTRKLVEDDNVLFIAGFLGTAP